MTAQRIFLTSALLGLTLAIGGCAAPVGAGTYSRGEARGEMSVRYGTLLAKHSVRLEDRGTVGMLVGGALGALGGSSLDGGRSGAALGILGAVGGAALGEAIDRSANAADGVELTIRLETGATVVVVQELDAASAGLSVGAPVQLVGSGRTTRVSAR